MVKALRQIILSSFETFIYLDIVFTLGGHRIVKSNSISRAWKLVHWIPIILSELFHWGSHCLSKIVCVNHGFSGCKYSTLRLQVKVTFCQSDSLFHQLYQYMTIDFHGIYLCRTSCLNLQQGSSIFFALFLFKFSIRNWIRDSAKTS